jgi:hypothetical protein
VSAAAGADAPAGGRVAWSALPLAERWSTVKMAPFLRDARKRGAEAAAAEVPAT